MTPKTILVLALALLVLTNSAFAENHPPTAIINGVSPEPVTEDAIFISCSDLDKWDEIAWRCKTDRWYYFSETDCTSLETDYKSAEHTNSATRQGSATVVASCSTGSFPYKYLCLWVEDESGLSGWTQSPELKIDCGVKEARINSPTSLMPETKSNEDSLEINFTVESADATAYSVEVKKFAKTICKDNGLLSGAGNYVHLCNWVNADNGTYNVIVKISDETGNEASSTMAGALIIKTNQAPVCKKQSIYLLGGRETGVDNALRLNDMCRDSDGDNLSFSIDWSDCLDLVESFEIDASENIDLGRPLKNDEITGFSEECIVSITASDGTLTTESSFDITVFKTGEIELKISTTGDAERFPDPDSPLVLTPIAGEACFTVVIENNKSKVVTNKPLDLGLVLDGSGSMQEEIDAVRDTISAISGMVSNLCVDEELEPIPNCFRLAAAVMEGQSVHPLFYEMDLTADTGLVRDMLDSVTAEGGDEPWADFTINQIDSSAIEPNAGCPNDSTGICPVSQLSWRDEATKIIIIISDARNETQPKNIYSYFDIADYANPAEVIVSAIGTDSACDPSGCPMLPPAEMEAVATATGGQAVVYDNPDEIEDYIKELIWREIGSDTVTITATEEPGWTWDPMPPFDIGILRGESSTVDVCITAPAGETVGALFIASINESGKVLDQAAIKVELEEAKPVNAIIKAPSILEEGSLGAFDGSDSTSEGMPLTSWKWDFGDESVEESQTAEHAFADDGIYTVKLTVSNGLEEDTAEVNVNIKNAVPEIRIESLDQIAVEEALELTAFFEDKGINDRLGITWDFSDGTITEAGPYIGAGVNNASHSWASEGIYVVKATVRDEDGGERTASKIIEVSKYPNDVFALTELRILKAGEEVSSFGLGETGELELTIKSFFEDPIAGKVPILGRVKIKIVDSITGETVEVYYDKIKVFYYGENKIPKAAEPAIKAEFTGFEEKNYFITAEVETLPPIEEKYTGNNSKRKLIGLRGSIATPVPEMPTAFVALILMAALIILGKKKQEQD